jgi:hypothetical protein
VFLQVHERLIVIEMSDRLSDSPGQGYKTIWPQHYLAAAPQGGLIHDD